MKWKPIDQFDVTNPPEIFDTCFAGKDYCERFPQCRWNKARNRFEWWTTDSFDTWDYLAVSPYPTHFMEIKFPPSKQ